MQHPVRFQPQPATHTLGSIERQAWIAWQQLQRSQWIDRASIESWQFQHLQRLLFHCAEHVPYYRELLGPVAHQFCDFRNLDLLSIVPIVDRRTYIENAKRLVSESLPTEMVRTGNLSTSGTTGIPVTVQSTNHVQAQWLAFTLRDFEWCGVDPRGRLAAIRCSGLKGSQLAKFQQGVVIQNWGQQISNVIETGVAHFMDVSADTSDQLTWLLETEPDYLLGYPSSLEVLAVLATDKGCTFPRLQKVQSIAEELALNARQRIELGFGVRVCDTYSCTEAGYLASPCPDGHGYHVHSENVILEVLNEQNLPCQQGETGRVVLTSLHNFATPFVRYDIHDDAELGPFPCPCGRNLPTLNRIHGKRRPMLRLPSGRLKYSSEIAIAIRSMDSALQYHLIQCADDQVRLKIIPKSTWTPEHSRRLKESMFEFFEAPIPLTIELVSRIEASANGKTVDIVVEPTR